MRSSQQLSMVSYIPVKQHGSHSYSFVFSDLCLDGEALEEMTVSDIDSFSQLSAGHRLKLRKLLKSLKTSTSPDPSSTQSSDLSSQPVSHCSQGSAERSPASSQ